MKKVYFNFIYLYYLIDKQNIIFKKKVIHTVQNHYVNIKFISCLKVKIYCKL